VVTIFLNPPCHSLAFVGIGIRVALGQASNGSFSPFDHWASISRTGGTFENIQEKEVGREQQKPDWLSKCSMLVAYCCKGREIIMRKLLTFKMLIVLFASSLFFATTAFSVKPGEEVNPNGFPCGEHYNLNLISKKEGFNCPDNSTNDETAAQNVIFIPVDNTDEIQIYMQSGKKKEIENYYTEFKVTDGCAGFEAGNSSASLVLPTHQEGYAVFARAVGKLKEGLNLNINDPSLHFVMDENGNDLLALGLIDHDGVASFLSREKIIYRRKGKDNKAVRLDELFMWSGIICYFTAQDTGVDQCCTDTTVPPDGTYDECIPLVDTVCPAGYVQVSCVTYPPTWVFNIADFVSYFWNVDNNGVKTLQIRFYPLPLCNE